MAKPYGLANQKLCYIQTLLTIYIKIWRNRLKTFRRLVGEYGIRFRFLLLYNLITHDHSAKSRVFRKRKSLDHIIYQDIFYLPEIRRFIYNEPRGKYKSYRNGSSWQVSISGTFDTSAMSSIPNLG